jgi:LPXTG-site transpeptidase (sortase) family protein
LVADSHTGGKNIMADSNDTANSPNNDSQNGFILPPTGTTVTPPSAGNNEAADLIRDKLAKIYADEPDALQEEREAETVPRRSKHQQFMYDLNHSGKGAAQIQVEWHNYYLSLPDNEKHEVWQEFYASNQAVAAPQTPAATPAVKTEKIAQNRTELAGHTQAAKKAHQDARSAEAVQRDIRKQVTTRKPKTRLQQHLHSLAFGLSMGAIAVIIALFGFFNEVFIAPFMQPSRSSQATPLIVSSDTVAPSSTPQVIIPKINVQIPLNFDETSTNEADIENDLEDGVVHYPTTSMPGQNGNVAFFGHSSNNIFNKGKYKFAFVLLHELIPGDTFYITKDGKVYAYKVFSKTIVDPSNVGVLNPVEGHSATATLITCDPPGTSLHRLIVVGDQISPDPAGNSDAPDPNASIAAAPVELAGNGPTLWGRFIGTIVGKAITGTVVVLAVLFIFRRINRPATNTNV